MTLENNTILITGGTSGIGYELGKALLEKDNMVILLGRKEHRLEALRKMGFETIKCDIGNPDEIEEAVVQIQNKYPDLNILFNNAGVQYNYVLTETFTSANTIINEININLTGQIVLTQLLLPVLSTSSKALIVNTTSALGAYPKDDGLVYSATKAAMRNFNQGLKDLLKDSSIDVVEFIPPVTDTGMTSSRDEKKMSTRDLVERIIPQIENRKSVATVTSIRMFLWIAFLFPGLARKILSK